MSGKKIAILGFSFKANTNDTRNSPSIKICKDLLDEGAVLSIYDPKVDKVQIENDLNILNFDNSLNNPLDSFIYAESIEQSIQDSHAILILTEWKEFYKINWQIMFKKMKRPAWIFDTRSIIDIKEVESFGFNVWQVGNKSFDN